MPLDYFEIFGEPPESPAAAAAFRSKQCPFVGEECSKRFASGTISGACTLVNPTNSTPVICCPKRFYADNHAILDEVASLAFSSSVPVVKRGASFPVAGSFVTAFGQGYGHEIRIPYATEGGRSMLSVDWVLALVGEDRELQEFVVLEVQTIDTTGNYQFAYQQLAARFDPSRIEEDSARDRSRAASFNFENVNKRILPQLITKGNVLRREPLCTKGLFFACPSAVLLRIRRRLGDLPSYPLQSGAITFLGYDLEVDSTSGRYRLGLVEQFTTTTDQLYLAFTSPRRLPAAGVYEEAVRRALRERLT